MQRRAALLAACVAFFAASSADATPPDTLSVPGREDHSPSLGIDPTGKLVMAWIATLPDTSASGPFDELYFATRTGPGWSAPAQLAGPGNYFSPSVVYAGDGARWICYVDHDGTDSKIRVQRYDGVTTQTFTLNDPARPDIAPAMCAARNDSVIVVWQAWRNNNYEIAMSVGNSAGMSAETILSECTLNDRDPAIVWGNNKAWIVWSSYRGAPYQLLCRTYNGTTLTPTVSLTNSTWARNLHPKVAFDQAHGLLWVHWIWVNQGWNGFNNNEAGLYDLGSPRLRAYDGTTVYLPTGLNQYQQYMLLPMESLGFERFLYDSGTRPMLDRYSPGVGVVVGPGSRVWAFHKQSGTITEFTEPNLYWGIVGLSYGGGSWSSASQILELRSTLGWEAPSVVATADSLFFAYSADNRSVPYFPLLNVFGNDLKIVVKGVPVDTSDPGPPQLTSLGPAYSQGACPPENHPVYQANVDGATKTLLWGDNHRHSLDLSWDADNDPPLCQTIMYSLDWLGHDFIMPADHAERYAPAEWAWVRKFTQLYDVPGRFRVFCGYERSMQGFAGGHQNVLYRDPHDFKAATAAFPVVNSWHTMYDAQQGIDVISVPHTTAQSGVMTDWFGLARGRPDSLRAPLRVAEVYQSARQSFEYPGCPLQYTGAVVDSTNGWISVMLATGMRMGLISASDHTIRAAFIGAYATDNSRDAIFQAIHDRHTFGTSRSTKMNVELRVAGAFMGTEVTSPSNPPINVVVHGAGSPLSYIEINKDGQPSWVATSCAGTDTSFTFTDPEIEVPGTSSFYYLRVRDSANHAIWTSPVWVNWTEGQVGTGVQPSLPSGAALSVSTFPNPARRFVDIRLAGVGPQGGRVRVYDVMGRLTRKLEVNGTGNVALRWDGRDESGTPVAAGVYFVVALSHGEIRTARVVMVK